MTDWTSNPIDWNFPGPLKHRIAIGMRNKENHLGCSCSLVVAALKCRAFESNRPKNRAGIRSVQQQFHLEKLSYLQLAIRLLPRMRPTESY